MHQPLKPARRNRRRGLGVLALVSLLLVPAAIALACNPQAQLTPNKSSFAPGESMTVSGAFFPRGVAIRVTMSTGSSVTATTNGSGAFQAQMTAPSSAGTYTVTAAKADGSAQSGLPKTASFQVAAPVSQAPSGSPAAPPAASRQAGPSFSEPGISKSPATGVAPSKRSTPSESGSVGGVAGGGTVVTGPSGAPVFAGSVAPAGSSFGAAPAAAERGSAGSSGVAAATDSDVWSGFANGRTPSLTSDAAGAPDGGTGSGLGLGIGLLAVGLLALVAGLTAAEVRRRRTTA